ncbi:MAG: peptide-methionine (S)-S-oxide reductase MsrA, partial [Candidatus Micrarchaeia archaeon]
FKLVDGVLFTSPGYAGGTTKNPTYEQICNGNTGHAEVTEVVFDPKKVKLEKILKIFFSMHDPTSINKQGNDVGSQYRSLILYTKEAQKKAIGSVLNKIAKNYEKPIVTEVKKLNIFYKAEEKHRNYFEKNPFQPYCMLVVKPKLDRIKAML